MDSLHTCSWTTLHDPPRPQDSATGAIPAAGGTAGIVGLFTLEQVLERTDANAVLYAGPVVFLAVFWGCGRAIRSRCRMTREVEPLSERLAVEREHRARLAAAGERSRIARELHAAVAAATSAAPSDRVSIRVVIVDYQQLIRDGFRMILTSEPDIEVVGEATTGTEAVAIRREVHPDVVLMDIRTPELDGIEATRRILARNHENKTNVLILTTFDLDEYVYDALRAGASGFLLKDVPEHQLIAGIRTVGDALLPSITRRLIEEFATARTPARTPPGLDELTPRELKVFQLLATGVTNAEIAPTTDRR